MSNKNEISTIIGSSGFICPYAVGANKNDEIILLDSSSGDLEFSTAANRYMEGSNISVMIKLTEKNYRNAVEEALLRYSKFLEKITKNEEREIGRSSYCETIGDVSSFNTFQHIFPYKEGVKINFLLGAGPFYKEGYKRYSPISYLLVTDFIAFSSMGNNDGMKTLNRLEKEQNERGFGLGDDGNFVFPDNPSVLR